MNIAIKIKELRESVGMTRKEFAEYTGIPIRTLEDWEAERRIPPAYVPRLLAYKLVWYIITCFFCQFPPKHQYTI